MASPISVDIGTDALRVVERAWSPVAVTEAEKDSIMQQVPDVPPGVPTLTRRDIPNEMPAFDRIYLDGAGHLIVQPNVSPERRGRVFDVFDDDGRYLGQVTADVAFETLPVLPQFYDDVVLGVTEDSLGVQYVVRARIEKPTTAHAP
jgi:hypothetical protein